MFFDSTSVMLYNVLAVLTSFHGLCLTLVGMISEGCYCMIFFRFKVEWQLAKLFLSRQYWLKLKLRYEMRSLWRKWKWNQISILIYASETIVISAIYNWYLIKLLQYKSDWKVYRIIFCTETYAKGMCHIPLM